MFHVCGAFAEFERNLTREPTVTDLKATQARGRNGGPAKKLNPKELKMIRTLLHSNEVPVQDIAAQLGANRSTLHRMTAPAARRTLVATNFPKSALSVLSLKAGHPRPIHQQTRNDDFQRFAVSRSPQRPRHGHTDKEASDGPANQ